MFRVNAFLIMFASCFAFADGLATEPSRSGNGMTDANKERVVLDDMEDVAGWQNGSPDETTLSRSDSKVKKGQFALRFANRIDHTKGEKNYPVGWPRTGKDLIKAGITDWSGYDFFECWIYAQTSRKSLPSSPLSVQFYHSGPKRSTSFPIRHLQHEQWVKLSIAVSDISDAKDIRRVQFSLAESNYKHGDTVDFLIDDMVLTRFVNPAIASFQLERRMLYSGDPAVCAHYSLVGYRGMDKAVVELSIDPGTKAETAKATAKAERQGEIVLSAPRALVPGVYSAALTIRDASGDVLDRRQATFQVIAGPFQ